MLLLTRKIGDSIVIGDSIKIQVVKVKGCQVRLGIEAPKDVRVFREEILKRQVQDKKLDTQSKTLSSDPSQVQNLAR